MSARRHLCCVALGRYPTVVTKREPLTTFCIMRREVASDVHVAIVSRRECSSDRALTAVVVPRGCNRVVEALATLVHNNFRAKFFREQLIASLKILSQGHIGLHAMKGSWAGAMGQCQFIPTSFLAYAADGDGDGRKDIWTNKLDVFASIVNYLRKVGWRPGMRWGDEVSSGAQAGGGGRIVRPAGAGGPAYQTTENFKVILRWNQSDFFALAVGLLSDRIAA